MTKEELKQEAKERADEYTNLRPFHIGYEEGYFDGAEPREKQIDELKVQIKVLEQNLEDTEICENGLKNRIAELEDKLANADYQLEGRDNEIKELEAQLEREKNLNQCMSDNNEQLRELIKKMKCCSNCKFGYKCSLFSTQIHKENGVEYQTQAKWNKEKEKYCNVGYSGKYECWEIKEK